QCFSITLAKQNRRFICIRQQLGGIIWMFECENKVAMFLNQRNAMLKLQLRFSKMKISQALNMVFVNAKLLPDFNLIRPCCLSEMGIVFIDFIKAGQGVLYQKP